MSQRVAWSGAPPRWKKHAHQDPSYAYEKACKGGLYGAAGGRPSCCDAGGCDASCGSITFRHNTSRVASSQGCSGISLPIVSLLLDKLDGPVELVSRRCFRLVMPAGEASAVAGGDACFCRKAGGALDLAGSGSGALKSSKSACDADPRMLRLRKAKQRPHVLQELLRVLPACPLASGARIPGYACCSRSAGHGEAMRTRQAETAKRHTRWLANGCEKRPESAQCFACCETK